MQDRVEAAPPAAAVEAPAPQAALPVPRQVREVRHSYGSPAEMNERWLRVQARQGAGSKRKAPAVSPASARPQRNTNNKMT